LHARLLMFAHVVCSWRPYNICDARRASSRSGFCLGQWGATPCCPRQLQAASPMQCPLPARVRRAAGARAARQAARTAGCRHLHLYSAAPGPLTPAYARHDGTSSGAAAEHNTPLPQAAFAASPLRGARHPLVQRRMSWLHYVEVCDQWRVANRPFALHTVCWGVGLQTLPNLTLPYPARRAQVKEALAYAAYAATNTFLPNVINAVTLFYGAAPCRDRDCDRAITALCRNHDRDPARTASHCDRVRDGARAARRLPRLPRAAALPRLASRPRRPMPGGWGRAGGRLVLDGRMSAGLLVSFMLYQQSLNSAFQARRTLLSSPSDPLFPLLAAACATRTAALRRTRLARPALRRPTPALTVSVPVILTVADGPPAPLQHKRPALPRRSQAPGDRVRVGQGRIWPTLP
jgi:hypothetical protein